MNRDMRNVFEAHGSSTIAVEVVPTCYQLLAHASATRVLYRSDILCGIYAGESASAFPTGFQLSLGGSSTATLRWPAVSGAIGYVLVAIGTGRMQALRAPTLSAIDPIGGLPTCYLFVAHDNTRVIAQSEVLGALPGFFGQQTL